jgi:hypothetical protein
MGRGKSGGRPRDPGIAAVVEVLCWCGRVKMYAPMLAIRLGTPQYCGISCSTLPPLSREDAPKPLGRPRKYDSNGNKL